MKEILESIGYPLPEDIEKLKWYGDFDGCLRLIEQRMAENIPETLRHKLRMEAAQIQRMQQDYTITPEEAEQVCPNVYRIGDRKSWSSFGEKM